MIKSRVQPNFAVAGDWSVYTVYLVMPGDWIQARFFSWVFDVADVRLEADGTSTLVVLKMNSNSPKLVDGEWSQFFIGFDGAAEHIAANAADDFKVGIMASDPAETSDCILDTIDVNPPESQSRVLPRRQRRQQLRQAARSQRTLETARQWEEYNKSVNELGEFEETVFIPVKSEDTVFVPAK